MTADAADLGPVRTQPDTQTGRRDSRRLGLALAVISLTQLMLVLDELIVNTALPHIQQALPATSSAAAGCSPRES